MSNWKYFFDIKEWQKYAEMEGKKDDGYTLTELIVVIATIFSIAIILFAVYATIHFVLKFW